MEAFTYLVVITGIIIGLAITQLLSSATDFLIQRDRLHFYWVHVTWFVLLFFVLLQYWFNLFGWRNIEYTFPSFLSSLVFPLCAYLGTAIVAAKIPADGQFDCERYYFRHKPWLFGLISLGLGYLVVHDRFVLDFPLNSVSNWIRLPSVLLLVILAISNSRRVHGTVTVVLLLAFIAFIAVNP